MRSCHTDAITACCEKAAVSRWQIIDLSFSGAFSLLSLQRFMRIYVGLFLQPSLCFNIRKIALYRIVSTFSTQYANTHAFILLQQLKPSDIDSDGRQLHCQYQPGISPFALYKAELLNHSPRVILFHDVMTDAETKLVKLEALQKVRYECNLALRSFHHSVPSCNERTLLTLNRNADMPPPQNASVKCKENTTIHCSVPEIFFLLDHGCGTNTPTELFDG
jgi:hypothetical protein